MTIQEQVEQNKCYFNTNTTRNLNWRREQLKQIIKLVTENEDRLIDALQKDLGKPRAESWLTETAYIIKDARHTLNKLNKWNRKRRVTTPVVIQPGRSFIQPEPLGTILIIGAWNYPFQLIFAPLIAVLAAGNCAVIKPSELAPHVSELIATLVPQYLDDRAISVIQGGVEETTELLAIPFDHIMYTGNGAVGRIVMNAASKHLTPVTLELGGKSPVYIDESANIDIAAQRIAWGKWLNAGQTCIAPDYILASQSVATTFIDALKKHTESMFGNTPLLSEHYGRIVNLRHAERIMGYLGDGEVVMGGGSDLNKRFIEPTVVLNPALDSPLMVNEIFGPILPIITVDGFESAKAIIKKRDKPLSSYIFSKNKAQINNWTSEISSGSQCINDVMMFNGVPELPFGGVGPSGMGRYSGKAGFDNFSHLKSVLYRPFLKDLPIRFAPFDEWKIKILKWLI